MSSSCQMIMFGTALVTSIGCAASRKTPEHSDLQPCATEDPLEEVERLMREEAEARAPDEAALLAIEDSQEQEAAARRYVAKWGCNATDDRVYPIIHVGCRAEVDGLPNHDDGMQSSNNFPLGE